MPRKATWLVIIWNGLMALWFYGMTQTQATLDNGQVAGEGMQALAHAGASVILFFIWFIGFCITSLIWFMTRPRGTKA